MDVKDDKSIFFLTLSFICIWIILDNIYGKKYLDNVLSKIFPFYNSPGRADAEDETIGKDTNDTKGLFKVPTIIDIFGDKKTDTKTESKTEDKNEDNSDKGFYRFGKILIPKTLTDPKYKGYTLPGEEAPVL